MTWHTEHQRFSTHRSHYSLPQLFALCITSSSDLVHCKVTPVFATVLTPLGMQPLHEF
jgi:hypothetical protein